MKKYALAALLALPLLTLAAQSASASNDCCTKFRKWPTERKYYVVKPAAVYERDDHDSQTFVRLRANTYVFAKCYRGWCQIEPRLYENAWVLAGNLEPADEPYRSDYRGEYRSGPRVDYYEPRRGDYPHRDYSRGDDRYLSK